MEQFILLAARRSGTTFVQRSLDSHPQIQCHKRVFDVKNKFRYFVIDRPNSKFHQFRTASIQRQRDYIFRKQQLIEAFMTELCVPVEDSKAIGIRLAYIQSDRHPEILKWATANAVGIIHLVRENVLKTLVSHATAKKRGIRHSTQKLPTVTVRLPPRRLKRRLKKLTRHIEKYRTMLKDKRHIEISYESFVANRDAETQRILDFLNIDQFVPLTTDLVKLNPDALQEIIENYEEVKRALSSTASENFLN